MGTQIDPVQETDTSIHANVNLFPVMASAGQANNDSNIDSLKKTSGEQTAITE